MHLQPHAGAHACVSVRTPRSDEGHGVSGRRFALVWSFILYSRVVKLIVREIGDEPRVAAFAEDVEELNALLGHRIRDYVATTPIGVRLTYYRATADVFVDGDLWAHLEGTCSRCLAGYPLRIALSFSIVLVPAREAGVNQELTADDLSLSFYRGEQINLSPLVREQLILALPTRPLCTPGCRGLCSQCGASLNAGDCGCVIVRGDPRLAVLRDLKIGD